ncbi:MAG TPA: hypothetical protein PK965_09085, partial [Anaerohalosphaeraceae bacterium]|nr:hypothetical protein [Anaerohalosphaeraceae bacterium]
GRIIAQCPEHQEGLILNLVDLNQTFYDPAAPFRDLAIRGILTNGPGDMEDERSQNRTVL